MLTPCDGRFRRTWDTISISLVTVACVLAPMELAFPTSFRPVHLWFAIDLFFDAIACALPLPYSLPIELLHSSPHAGMLLQSPTSPPVDLDGARISQPDSDIH